MDKVNTESASSVLKNLRGITYAFVNIRSLFKNFDDIKLLLELSQVDVLLLGETFLNKSVNSILLEVPGYTFHRYDRDLGSGKRSGGGLAAYTRDHYEIDLIPDWMLCTPDLEYLWLRLSLKDTRPTYIGGIYRPPSGKI